MVTLMGYEQPFEGGDFGGWSKKHSPNQVDSHNVARGGSWQRGSCPY